MKKIVASVILSLFCVLSLAACGDTQVHEGEIFNKEFVPEHRVPMMTGKVIVSRHVADAWVFHIKQHDDKGKGKGSISKVEVPESFFNRSEIGDQVTFNYFDYVHLKKDLILPDDEETKTANPTTKKSESSSEKSTDKPAASVNE